MRITRRKFLGATAAAGPFVFPRLAFGAGEALAMKVKGAPEADGLISPKCRDNWR